MRNFCEFLVCIAAIRGASAAATPPPPASSPVNYDGFKVFRVPVRAEAERVNDIMARLGLNVWQPPSRKGAFADIEVPPAKVDDFRHEMQGFELETMHEDLGKSIADEASFETYAVGSANDTWFLSYHPYQQHLQWLQALQAQHPKNSEIVTSGTSLQGNDITGIHFYGNGGKGSKPAVVFHGTVHAREWIASMVVEYFAYSLLSDYESDQEIRGFLDKYDFYMFPIVNPDGFKYTQTTNRLWRKNRQPGPDGGCYGRDINRNWPYKWDSSGSSTNPCAEDYRGEKESDAPETNALSSFLSQVKQSQGLKLYIDYHSYSQLFMTPYGWTCDETPTGNDELQALAGGAAEAIKSVHGTQFNYGPICSTIYQVAGSSVDWVQDVAKSDYTFTSELRDTGRFGFVLPPDQIKPSGEEAFAGVKHLLKNMK